MPCSLTVSEVEPFEGRRPLRRSPPCKTSCVPGGPADPFALLSSEFRKLQLQLRPLCQGIEAGLTSLRSRLDRLAVAALVADDQGGYLAVNRAASALTGYRRDELERMCVWDLTPVPDLHTGERLWAAFIEMREQRGTYSLQGKHGTIHHVHYLARAHVLPGMHLSLLCCAD